MCVNLCTALSNNKPTELFFQDKAPQTMPTFYRKKGDLIVDSTMTRNKGVVRRQ